ncbi:MAG: hypothetical protein WD972_02845, partial [Candidatus Andersenbacteria bacterium]
MKGAAGVARGTTDAYLHQWLLSVGEVSPLIVGGTLSLTQLENLSLLAVCEKATTAGPCRICRHCRLASQGQ